MESRCYNIEGLGALREADCLETYTVRELEYIKELLSEAVPELLIERIDEISPYRPPKAIDANKDVAQMISPVIENIDPIYLEAPQDYVQIEEISEKMTELEGLKFPEWQNLNLEQRVNVLQQVEGEAARIAHRPECDIYVESLGDVHYGYFDPATKTITLNSDYVGSDILIDYKETLDTIIHEGRHAYQDYNLNQREVHPREGDLTNWKSNEFEYGYQYVRTQGFAAYWLQPQEADARAFAEDVLKKFQEKI